MPLQAPDLTRETAAAARLGEAMREHGYDEDDVRLTIESETDFTEAVSLAVRRLAELAQLEAGARALARQYEARGKALAERQETLRGRIVGAIEDSGVALPLRLPCGTVGVTRQPAGAVVTALDELPQQYVRIDLVRVPLMREIAAGLRRGEAIHGAILRNAQPSLQVRAA